MNHDGPLGLEKIDFDSRDSVESLDCYQWSPLSRLFPHTPALFELDTDFVTDLLIVFRGGGPSL